MTAFQSSENKHVVRRNWDKPVICAQNKLLGRKLTYLGLPGPSIHELIDWKNHLSPLRTGVELNRKGNAGQEDRENQRRILHNIMFQDDELSSGFQLLRGWMEDIILRGIDDDGAAPQLGDGYVDGRFQYDLINLDFCGGLGYRDKLGHSKRIKAIRKLAERQQGNNFLLLLTLNVRDTMGDEVVNYLRGTRKRYRGHQSLRNTLQWYSDLGKGKQAHILKAAVPLFIQQDFEVFGFQVFSYPPIMYEGTGDGSKLINFIFDARHESGSNLPVISEQHPEEIIHLPLMEVVDQKIQFAPEQYPGFDSRSCAESLKFLDSETLGSIVQH